MQEKYLNNIKSITIMQTFFKCNSIL